MVQKRVMIILIAMGWAACMDAGIYGVLLAGGNGTRLWPISRHKKPKQLLSVPGARSLLGQTIDRVMPLLKTADDLLVVTMERYADAVREAIGNEVGEILTEPCGRNTAAAVLYSCLHLYDKDPDAVIIFLPADVYIPVADHGKFIYAAAQAISCAQEHDVIALMGARPTYPATGYGYIEYDALSKTAWHAVYSFHEKPSFERARDYIARPNMLWNLGVFCAKASLFIQEFKVQAADLYETMHQWKLGLRSYEALPSISMDYAVIEKSKRVAVVPADVRWSDVGTVQAFLTLQQEHDKTGHGSLIQVNAKNNMISVPDTLVALVGVDDLCVVQTDGVLLISSRHTPEQVGKVVDQLKESNLTEYL